MLELKWSGHLNHFKNLLGQTNHYLITILIGLEGVRTGKVTKEENFHVTWNPISLEDSSVRSRRFARNSALSWSIDALDAYLGFLRKKPFQFGEELNRVFSSRSVYQILKEIVNHSNYQIDIPLSIVHLGIQWRNNLVHFHADNELDTIYRDFLLTFEYGKLDKRFRNLDTKKMIENFDKNNSPTFKEVAAIIQCIHYLVLELDKILIQNIDLFSYCAQLVEENKIEVRNIANSSPDKRIKRFEQFLVSKGFSISSEMSVKKGISVQEIEALLKIK